MVTGFRMFAVGVGNAVEDELREIASEPVAEHYFYTADFRTISNIGKKLQMKICVGESGGLGRGGGLLTAFAELMNAHCSVYSRNGDLKQSSNTS